jgi:HSP20 family protein
MQEQLKQQHIPVKVYRTDERLMVAVPMPGLEPENIVVEVTADSCLLLHEDVRSMLKEVKELLLDEFRFAPGDSFRTGFTLI